MSDHNKQYLREIVLEAAMEAISHRRQVARKEAACRRRLRRWNMRLRRRNGRYQIFEAYTYMYEADRLTLDDVTAWIDARESSIGGQHGL